MAPICPINKPSFSAAPMKEIEDILRSYSKAVQQGKRTALATVVHVEGSSYRRPGARMLVTEDGELTGAISGGCLEGDALRKALLAINQQQNKLVTYDTTDDEDSHFGIQLGCNGIVYILFEPIQPNVPGNPMELLKRAALETNAPVLITLFNLGNAAQQQPGTCRLITRAAVHGVQLDAGLSKSIDEDAQTVLETKISAVKTYREETGNITGFIELIKPAVQLCIAGAGNDVLPILDIAAVLGWRVTIADGRKTHANTKRFLTAASIIVGKPTEVIQQLKLNEQSMVVLMSHNYQYDLGMLRLLINRPLAYLGILGPKKKLDKMLNELMEEGIAISDLAKEKIYGPVGLDIGAETAEEIALSIIAEIKAVLTRTPGKPLREKPGYIHNHIPVVESTTSTHFTSLFVKQDTLP